MTLQTCERTQDSSHSSFVHYRIWRIPTFVFTFTLIMMQNESLRLHLFIQFQQHACSDNSELFDVTRIETLERCNNEIRTLQRRYAISMSQKVLLPHILFFYASSFVFKLT